MISIITKQCAYSSSKKCPKNNVNFTLLKQLTQQNWENTNTTRVSNLNYRMGQIFCVLVFALFWLTILTEFWEWEIHRFCKMFFPAFMIRSQVCPQGVQEWSISSEKCEYLRVQEVKFFKIKKAHKADKVHFHISCLYLHLQVYYNKMYCILSGRYMT